MTTTHDRLAELSASGVSVWLDDLSRRRLASGNLARLVADRHVAGVTSNPTTFAKAVAQRDDYAAQVSALAARNATVDEAVREITTDDVRAACDLLRDVSTATDGVDGKVSLEVDPGLAHDTDATVAQVLDLWKTVARPNLMVKIPATTEGLPAITRALGEGISVNVTLIFSVRRYREVLSAFLVGLQHALANGHDLSSIASVASFFVSRVDTEVDRRLTGIGTGEALALRGKAALANARLAYDICQEVLSGEDWDALAEMGARPQRPLWASTGVKNPDYPDTMYVTELVAPNVVNTMPEETIEAFADHGALRGDTVTGTAAQARQVFDGLAEAGVDMDAVYAVLEREGVDKFAASWRDLRQTVAKQLEGASTDAAGK